MMWSGRPDCVYVVAETKEEAIEKVKNKFIELDHPIDDIGNIKLFSKSVDKNTIFIM